MAIQPDAVRVFAPAKINLFLHVNGRRPDGYHDLESLVAFADVGDLLLVERASELSLTVDGPFAADLANEQDNLVLKAARTLAARVREIGGARFKLTKNLPVASGIGGGSANAAAAIRGLLALYRASLASKGELLELAASIGSDVPVCIDSSPAWMEGRGEHVSGAPPLPPMHLVLVNPGVSVSTAEVFRNARIESGAPRLARPAAFGTLRNFLGYLAAARNNLQAPALALAPVIETVLSALAKEGAALSRMSGSGASCFGIFETAEKARGAARSIALAQPIWWCRASSLIDADAARPANANTQ